MHGTIGTEYSAVPLKRGQFSPKLSQKTHQSSPVRARYGVSVVILKSDSLSATVITVPYVISWWIGPRYNGTNNVEVLTSLLDFRMLFWGVFPSQDRNGALTFSLLLSLMCCWTNKQSSCRWFETLWHSCESLFRKHIMWHWNNKSYSCNGS